MDVSSADQITAYLDATTGVPDGGVDLIFIPGTMLAEPALEAAELLRRDVAPVAVLTGGINARSGRNEAREHYRLMHELGIASDRLIVEDRSSNTLENVTFSLPLVQERCGSIVSVLAVAKWMHSRRVLMTLKRNWPPGIRYYASTYDPEGITRTNWRDSPSAATVERNWVNIPRYLAAGHLAEISRDHGAFV